MDSMSPTVPPSCVPGVTGHCMLQNATHLDDTDIGLLAGLVDGYPRYPLEPVLDGIGDVRDDLDCLAEVVSFPLCVRSAMSGHTTRWRTSRSMTCW
jgi:hypothetical protein